MSLTPGRLPRAKCWTFSRAYERPSASFLPWLKIPPSPWVPGRSPGWRPLCPTAPIFSCACRAMGRSICSSAVWKGRKSLLACCKGKPAPPGARTPGRKKDFGAFLAAGRLCCFFCLLAYLFHPAVGALPLFLYAPCVLLAFGAFSLLVYFFVLHHRGL